MPDHVPPSTASISQTTGAVLQLKIEGCNLAVCLMVKTPDLTRKRFALFFLSNHVTQNLPSKAPHICFSRIISRTASSSMYCRPSIRFLRLSVRIGAVGDPLWSRRSRACPDPCPGMGWWRAACTAESRSDHRSHTPTHLPKLPHSLLVPHVL